jgi:hypothetical protein
MAARMKHLCYFPEWKCHQKTILNVTSILGNGKGTLLGKALTLVADIAIGWKGLLGDKH